jgi:Flp pilus assembly protein TadD
VKQFERATQEYANYYEAYSQMGVAYMEMKNAADAEPALRKAIELSNEKYVDALFWIASLYTNNSRYAEAEPMARKAVKLDANSWQSQTELARALLGLGRASEARDSILTAIKLRPDNANLYLILGDTHIASQNYAALADDLDHYLTIAPKGQFAEQARKERDLVRRQLQASEALSDAAQLPNR